MLPLPLPVIWRLSKVTGRVHCIWLVSDKCPWLWVPSIDDSASPSSSWCKQRVGPSESPEGKSHSHSSLWGFWISLLPLPATAQGPLLSSGPFTSPHHLSMQFSTNLHLQESLYSYKLAGSPELLQCLVWIALSLAWLYIPLHRSLLLPL